MSLDPTTFKTIVPSRCITFTIPNPLLHLHHFTASQLRIAVLDSPVPSDPLQIAAMLVPINRESDWYFSTEQGHRQLLVNFPHLSRLIVVGNLPNSPNPVSYNKENLQLDGVVDLSVVEENLMPLLIELMPIEAFCRAGGGLSSDVIEAFRRTGGGSSSDVGEAFRRTGGGLSSNEAFCRTSGGLVEIPFLKYEDEVVRSLVLERCVGDLVGEMLIEDVEMELENGVGREFRRRLRFKRMPNLVQTQIKIRPKKVDFVDMEEVEFEIIDDGVLVHPYLNPMVAGLSVIESFLDAKIGNGIKAKALCLGVGGGALLGFLSSQLGFHVLGIEVDNVVLQVARRYFGLEHGNLVHLCVGDALEMIGKFATQLESDGFRGYVLENCERLDDFDGKFDVIMVDLDSSDASTGVSAPPMEVVEKSMLLAIRTLLSKDGVVIINVIPSDQSYYKLVMIQLQEVFAELYEIDVGNGDNFVLIASASETGHVSSHHQSKFLKKLKQVSGSYVNSIRIVQHME